MCVNIGKSVIKKGESHTCGYEIYELTKHETEHILANFEYLQEKPHTLNALNRPIVTSGVNRMDVKMSLDNVAPFAWHDSGPGASWDMTQGYDDSFSLKLTGKNAGDRSEWGMTIGQEMFMEPMYAGKRYRLKFAAKTANVSGRLYASAGLGVPKYPTIHGEEFPPITTLSGDIKGTADWTEYEIITDIVPDLTHRAYIDFILEGEGEAWIDNVLFEAIR